MINWRAMRRELPGLLKDIGEVMKQTITIVADLADKDPTRIPVPHIRVMFTDEKGETCGIRISFELEGTSELELSEMTEYRRGDVIRPPRAPGERARPLKCLLCDYTGADLDALGLCASCLPPST